MKPVDFRVSPHICIFSNEFRWVAGTKLALIKRNMNWLAGLCILPGSSGAAKTQVTETQKLKFIICRQEHEMKKHCWNNNNNYKNEYRTKYVTRYVWNSGYMRVTIALARAVYKKCDSLPLPGVTRDFTVRQLVTQAYCTFVGQLKSGFRKARSMYSRDTTLYVYCAHNESSGRKRWKSFKGWVLEAHMTNLSRYRTCFWVKKHKTGSI